MIDFDCLQFQRWLDEGGAAATPAGDAPCAAEVAAAHLHAATCPSCAQAWAAERSVARALAAALPAVPDPSAGFADRVMARVAVVPQDRRADAARFVPVPGSQPDALPWWIRAMAQPASALALALAGFAVLLVPRLPGLSAAVPAWSAGAVTTLAGAVAPWIAPLVARTTRDPWFGPALALAILPLVVLASLAAYRLGLGLASPAHPAGLALARPARA